MHEHSSLFLTSISTNWIGHILRRNFLLNHVIQGKIKGMINVTGRWGRTRKQLLENLQGTRRYWKSKEEALDHTVCCTLCGRGYGLFSRLFPSRSQDNSILSTHLLAILMLNMKTSITYPYSKFTVIHTYGACVLLTADQLYVYLKKKSKFFQLQGPPFHGVEIFLSHMPGF